MPCRRPTSIGKSPIAQNLFNIAQCMQVQILSKPVGDFNMKKIILIVATLFIFCLCSCKIADSSNDNCLPSGSTNITDLGNDWSTFEYNGKKFLYHAPNSANGYEAITQIQ